MEKKEKEKFFSNLDQVITAYQNDKVGTHAKIKVRINGKLVDTTPGRVLFNEILPEVDRDYSKTYGKKQIKSLNKNLYMKHMDLQKQLNL